jgi:hypothetical protein
MPTTLPQCAKDDFQIPILVAYAVDLEGLFRRHGLKRRARCRDGRRNFSVSMRRP